MGSTVRYEVVDRVATITLDRPHRLNAWTGRMHAEYRTALATAETDDDVRVVIVTGEGRAFCAGADAAALDQHVDAGAYDPGVDAATLATPGHGVRPEFDHAFAFHYGVLKPIIAAVNGPAAGVGLVLACYCDLRFAARGAKLTTAHGKLGLPAEYGLSWVLPRLVGVTHAADLLLSSRTFVAEDAPPGLLNGVVAGDELFAHVRDYALTLAHHVAPASLAATKRQLYADLHDDLGTAVARSEQMLERMVAEGGPALREGVRAIREKRPPEF